MTAATVAAPHSTQRLPLCWERLRAILPAVAAVAGLLTAAIRRARPLGIWASLGLTLALALVAHIPQPAQAAELLVDEGVVIKFGADAQLVVRDRMTAGPGLVLTSLRDDTKGGQTNPGAQSAMAGDWLGLRIEKSAASFGALALSDTLVRFGGAGLAGVSTGAAVTLRALSPSFQYLQVNDGTTGLLLLDGASPSISGGSFLRNTTGIDVGGGASPTISATQFAGNTGHAVFNRTPTTLVTATGNWWGDSSGPKDLLANPQGKGDAVSAGVNYGNWLTGAPLLAPSIRLAAPAAHLEVRTVVLDLSCVNATEFRVAEAGAFAGLAFQGLNNGKATVNLLLSDGDGRKELSVQFRNASGTVATATLESGVLVDTQGPKLAITNPAAGSVVTDPISIEATASDSAGVGSVEFRVDGVLLGTRTAPPYALTWDPGSLTEGPHTLSVLATDILGKTTSVSLAVTVQRSPTVARVVSAGLPASNYSASAVDPLAGTAESAFNGGNWTSGTYTGWVAVDLGATYTLTKVESTPGVLTASGATSETRTERILVSTDGMAFAEAYAQSVVATNGVRRTQVLPSPTARYIRLEIPASQSWVALSDIQVFGVPYPPGGAPDQQGPVLSNVAAGGTALANGPTLSRSTTLAFDASDRSGIARIELLVNGQLTAAAASTGSGRYSVPFNIAGLANGAHTLTLRAVDSLNNVSTTSFAVTVAHAAPDAPLVTSPATGTTTRTAAQVVAGTAPPGSSVQLLLGGAPSGAPVPADTAGRFVGAVTLLAGQNQIQATATDAWGTSAPSPAVVVNLDLAVPASPANLAALAQTQGKVRLNWTRSNDPNATGVDIYRAAAPFNALSEAVKVNGTPLPPSQQTYDDLPAQDGTWFYRVVAVNAAGTPSAPTNQAQAVADSVSPRALSIVYTPLGKVDATTGRIGQGRVDLVVTVSEPLQAVPYLAVVPQGGSPITIALVKTGNTTYAGAFAVDASTPAGLANTLFSSRDLVGNRGTEIDGGATLRIDTEGPALTGIVLTPSSPIRNEGAPILRALFSFSKPPKAGTTPQLSYLLSGPVRQAVALNGLSQVDASTWQASFTLPADGGLAGPEMLSFTVRAIDDLDNVSNKVTAVNRFQVYQGNLPPLNVPLAFTAKAQPGGKVRLQWQAVAEASSYQIYRQAPGQTELLPLARASAESYIDSTPKDGSYRYAVATVRQNNAQESLSVQSPVVDVVTSATAPGAPQGLALRLTGQGIVATWQPPLASVVDSYRLYRAAGVQINSIEGLTPLKTGLRQPVALDASPSPLQGAYVVTAVDAAGNESALSNSAYLNASLLPVTNLRVDQLGADLPVIRWDAPPTAVAGYNIYVGPDVARVKLNAGLLVGNSLTDTGFTSGERRYTVAAVDANGVEMPRSVLLPAVHAQIAAGLPVLRGVFNKLQVQLTNTSATALSGVQAVVRLPINRDATAFKEHKSEPLPLGPNQTLLVPVVVGGYAELPDNVQAQVGAEIAANEGELVRINRTGAFSVGDGAIVVGMATESFTRGAAGKVRLSIENTSEVDLELLTATNSGTGDSTELRFKILDGDGNVLSTQSYRQALGGNVVTLTNGLTVARIPARTTYLSDSFEIQVPLSSPLTIRVRLEVDKLRYHSGAEDEVVIAGKGTEKVVSLVETAYYGEVTAVSPLTSFGDQPVVITGRALDRRGNAPMPNTRLKLVLNQQGFERSFSVLTDNAGQFVYTMQPTLTDSGLYRVSAVHPDMTDRPEQKAFTINRVTVGPSPYKLDLPKNYTFTVPFTANAGAGTSARNLRLALNAASQPTGQLPAGVTAQLPAPVNLAERQTLGLPVSFVANNDAQPSGTLVFDVLSDDHPGSPIGLATLNYTLSEALPFLNTSPSFVETGLAQGGSGMEQVLVQNKGLQDALNLRFTLTMPDGTPSPAWSALANNADGNLAVGELRTVALSFTPPPGTAEGVYELRLNVVGDNLPAQFVNVFASVTQSGQGHVLFKAADIYTATVDKNGQLIPGLAGATVTLQNEEVASISYELTTDALGEALFQNVPAGRYKFRARANNHQEVGGRVTIKPGITVNQSLFLNYNLITVEWSVREITIQDRYEITLNATFETDVPAAVVVMQPASVNLPKMNPGDVFFGELSLMNYGLVRADNLKQTLPQSDPYFHYEFLVDVPTTLAAKQRVTIPYRVVAKQGLETAASTATASGGGCYNYSNQTQVNYSYICSNGTETTGGCGTAWFSVSNSTCTGGSGGGPVGGGGAGGIGGPGGGGSSSGPSTPIKLKGMKCVWIPTGDTLCGK